MKNLLRLTLLATIIFIFTAASPEKRYNRKTLVSVYAANGTAWHGNLTISGALNDSFGTSGYYYLGQVQTGSYTVTLSVGGPATSHTYMFTNAPTQVSSSGSVTWTGVSISGTSTASIY